MRVEMTFLADTHLARVRGVILPSPSAGLGAPWSSWITIGGCTGWFNLFDMIRPVELSVPREYFGICILADGALDDGGLDDAGCGDVLFMPRCGTFRRADGARIGEGDTPSGLVAW
jgi:hypothetical protein